MIPGSAAMQAHRTAPQSLRAAVVGRVHGVHGEVRAEPLGGDRARFRRGMRLSVEGTGRPLKLRSARAGSDGSLLLGFHGVDSPEQAAELRGAYLCVEVGSARRLGPDEWFVWQLVGLRCVSEDGTALGTIADVEPAPAADILVVDGEDGVRRYPMVREFVRGVDVGAGVVTIAPQPEEST